MMQRTNNSKKKNCYKVHSCSVVAIFNWFDSASNVVNAFRRGSLLSSSQLCAPKQTKKLNKTIDKEMSMILPTKRSRKEGTREKNNELIIKSGIRWLSSAGYSAYKLTPKRKPVIWSVELEYLQIVTAITKGKNQQVCKQNITNWKK